jgi:ABC-type nitrate/sulfonate/bicarbonate transport system permease component
LLILAWYLLTGATHAIKPLYFPSMSSVWDSLSKLKWTLAKDAETTAWRVVVSWAIGCSLGTAVGLILAKSRVAYALANPIIEALRPVPPIALVPFTLIWFGLTDTGRIVLGALGCFMILVVSTIVAARNVNPVYIRAAQSLGATSNQVYRTIILRAILPNLVSAFRVSAALTWAVIVAAEYLGAQSGIGYLILQASYTVNTAVVLIGTVTVGLEALLFEQFLRISSTWLTRWVERIDGSE